MPLLYLRRPLSALDEAQFGVLTCKPLKTNPLFVLKMTFFDICTDMEEFGCVLHFITSGVHSHDKGAKEILCQPDEPFFVDPPLWLPIITTSWVRAVVFLTNQLSNTAKQTLEQLIVLPIDVDSDGSSYDSRDGQLFPVYSTVPWREDAAMIDGKVEDIWELVRTLYVYPKTPERGTISFVCVDRQFELDQSVILVLADE
ncbi:hypothetical protein N7449_005555 [Penicillium cf. viridicatum]|uniref:Uncharacterized protein n=1 Tax=Penicillium cf. viridicatum TaxID=2972119 RepID=A0A9W9MLC9_9EURO|nr:hypothetical protein N7449_005555 [Penicillium cf. viridicatum]